MHTQASAAPLHPVPEKGSCVKLGFCVCEGQGALAMRLHTKIISWLKPSLVLRAAAATSEVHEATPVAASASKATTHTKKEKPPARRLVEDARLVLRLQFLPLTLPADADVAAWRKVRARVADPVGHFMTDSCAEDDIWVHVGYMNFKTWMFTVQRVTPVECRRSGDTEIWTLASRASVTCSRSLEFLSKEIDFTAACSVRTYRIRCVTDPLLAMEMAPDRVTVEEFFEVPREMIWLGTDAEDAAKRSARRNARGSGRGRRNTHAAAKAGTGRSRGRGRIRPGAGRRVAPAALLDFNEGAADEDEAALPELVEGADVSSEEELVLDELFPELFNGDGNASQAPAMEGLFPEPAEQPEPASSSRDVPEKLLDAGLQQPPAAEDVDPAPVVPRHNAHEAAERRKADIMMHLPEGGSIHYYQKGNRMVAFCPRCENDCRRRRTLNYTAERPHQGRPLGMLLAWLIDAKNCASRAEHQQLCLPSRAQRQHARDTCRRLPQYVDLASKERQLRDGEAEE